ncbi:hypothetical protein K435DRAFT_866245 [Dendrothele bispora CBS 962.96]|uniref:Uncharacterized protein n=1 Tax=Dendrothele bispora (strain CBS 962.96) TaxID=1314807 RepID=A0A4S8LHK2_DENBC|nr:hypothetical protein K435DRAFT_866245 [Dendrothele bispora CBS 962.96]
MASQSDVTELPYTHDVTEPSYETTEAGSSIKANIDLQSPSPPTRLPGAIQPSRSGRSRFLPSRYLDALPTLSHSMPNLIKLEIPIYVPSPSPMPETELDKEPQDADAIPQNVIYIDSEPDYFGIYRSYPETTATIPDEEVPISDICVGPSLPSAPLSRNPYSVFGTVLSNARSFVQNLFAPFSNASEYRLISWFYRHDSKSLADLDDLVQNVLLADDFQLEDLEGFSTVRIMRQMDEHRGARAAFREEDGWIESSVKIPLPAEGFCIPESKAATLEIDGIFHRDMLDVITSVFESPASNNFHYSPHKLHRQQFPRSASPEHLRSKLYDSDAFIREYGSVTQAEHK